MAGTRLNIALDDKAFQLGTKQLTDAAANLRPMMTIAGAIFENSTRERFDTERGPGGIPWPPTWKQRAGAVGSAGPVKSGKILQDTGLLRGSIISQVGDNYVETGVDGRSVSSKYAASHQFGVTIKPKSAKALAFTGADGKFRMVQSVTLPARPFMGIDEDDLLDLREAFLDYLEGATDGS